MTKISRHYACICEEGEHHIVSDNDAWEYVGKMIADLGETIVVIDKKTKKAYAVPRIYIAMHGLKTEDLATKGFRELI